MISSTNYRNQFRDLFAANTASFGQASPSALITLDLTLSIRLLRCKKK